MSNDDVEPEKEEKMTRELNELLIERIKNYNIQETNQLINGPDVDDLNISFLGGLINFDGNTFETSDIDLKNHLEKMTINDIYIEPYKYKEYDDEEEIKEQSEINQKKTKFDFNNNINGTDSIKILLTDNYNDYLNLIQKNYEKYSHNHLDKSKMNNLNTKNIVPNLPRRVYETKKGEKIVLNDEIYETSLTYLQNKELYNDIPKRFQQPHDKYTIDYNLLEKNVENIQIINMELIELNKKVSTSMSRAVSYCNKLDKYIKQNLPWFNESVNVSFNNIKNDKEIVSKIKLKTMNNSGKIVLKRIKMNNINKIISVIEKYTNLKNKMNSLELLFTKKKKTQEIYELINVCKDEIESIKNLNKKTNSNEEIIGLFENKLSELKNKNEAQMFDDLSKEFNDFFSNFINFEEIDENFEQKDEKLSNFGISKFILDKILSNSPLYESILLSLEFLSPEKKIEKISNICDYYTDDNSISNIYSQLRGIFLQICEQTLNNILSIFSEKVQSNNNNNNQIKEESYSINTTKENEVSNIQNETNQSSEDNNNNNNITNSVNSDSKDKLEENKNQEANIKEDNNNNNNIKDDIFILFCILLAKNKLKEGIISFIDLMQKKVEDNKIIDKTLKEKAITEFQDIKKIILDKIKNAIKEQIRICLKKISLNTNLDNFINDYYLVLEMIKDEVSNYDNINPDDNTNSNKLIKIILKSQKNFVENWAKNQFMKFESGEYKTWAPIKDIPPVYQKLLDLFFFFDLENNCMKDETIINKYPIEKINLLKESIQEEDNNDNENENEDKNLLTIKGKDKPEISIRINKTSLDIINLSFDLLKMFSLFHKECYEIILEKASSILLWHLNYQKKQIYDEKPEAEVTQLEVSISYSIFLLIHSIYEHIKESDFFIEIADLINQKLIDNYLDINKDINNCFTLSKKKIEELLDNICIKESLKKLEEINLPNYNVVTGGMIVNEYAIIFVGTLKDIYESMITSYEESFIKELINKTLRKFFDKFEDFIFHGQKIEDEDCLKQFKKDMIFLKKNMNFIKILDLTDIKNRIDNINKSVLPKSMLKPKK